jgi:hypothetical protein
VQGAAEELVKEKVISCVPAAPDWPTTAIWSPGRWHVPTAAGAVVVVEMGEDVVGEETGDEVGGAAARVVVVACCADGLAEHAVSPTAMAIERPPAAVLIAGFISTVSLLAVRPAPSGGNPAGACEIREFARFPFARFPVRPGSAPAVASARW